MTDVIYSNPKHTNTIYTNWILPNLPHTKKEWFWFLFIILVIVVLMGVAINNYISMAYKLQLLQSPCELCESFGNKCSQVINQINGMNLGTDWLKNVSVK